MGRNAITRPLFVALCAAIPSATAQCGWDTKAECFPNSGVCARPTCECCDQPAGKHNRMHADECDGVECVRCCTDLATMVARSASRVPLSNSPRQTWRALDVLDELFDATVETHGFEIQSDGQGDVKNAGETRAGGTQ